MPAPVVGVFVVACAVAVGGYYADVPGFALLAGSAVGMITFGGVLAVLILGVKWLQSRPKVQRVQMRFRDLTDEQRRFLLGVRESGRSWFKGYAEDQAWFKELVSAEYIELSRPLIMFLDEPCSYQLTRHGALAIDRAIKKVRRNSTG
ncbi:MAG: hypothetical protein GC206_16430 [Alphaproteobacteria bacterium]|nr:hypothetical protein [Alphaproteobacteria bacterium]